MPAAFQVIIVFFLGLVFGSFSTAVSWRAARNESWVTGRSECPSCHAKLGVPDLIPVFSWLFLRGRCRHCGAPIGLRYPLTELIVLLGCFGIYAAWGFTVTAYIGMAALPFLAALFIVDVEQMILPDKLNVILGLLGAVLVAWLSVAAGSATPALFHVAAAFIYAALIWGAAKAVGFVVKKDALGFGDVKFFAVAGLWFGFSWLPVFLLLGGVFGLLCGLGWRSMKKGARFPFGPALILAFYVCFLLWGAGFNPVFGL